MDAVERAARALGRAIQGDSRYQAYQEALAANDADASLQEMIQQYNKAAIAYHQEQQRTADQPDESAMEALEQKAQQIYSEMMQNPHMMAYDAAKQALDDLVQQTEAIFQLCVMGEDPDTCEPPSAGCAGNCGSCSGCGT
ncbi:MAG: YlbF family regulator [Ruminococcus sp.]|nr:YlbF family regulator [Ruminococcus sp.]